MEHICEQFGYVLVEAMICGLPVVSTYCGPIPNVVINKRAGFLVSPGDFEALANVIEKLVVEKTLRAKLGKKGTKLVRKKFDASKNARRLYKICCS